jgi:hypothetical protein
MSFVSIAIAAAVIVLVIVRRFTGQPVRDNAFVLPLGLTVWGAVQLRAIHIGTVDIAFLAIEALLAIGVGAARGATIHLYRRDGQLWQRYRWTTLAVWIAAIALRAGLVVGGRLADVHVATRSLVLVLGISLVAESALVSWRAARTGVPLAPSRRRIPV